MINKVTLIGNLGKDPEVRHLESGASVARFSIATNENYKDKNDEWQTRTEWHVVVAWRALAEAAERSLKKGSLAYVEGKLRSRTYQDSNGVERTITEVDAQLIRSLDRRSGSGSNDDSFPTEEDDPFTDVATKNSAANKTGSSMPNNNDDDDPKSDLPF